MHEKVYLLLSLVLAVASTVLAQEATAQKSNEQTTSLSELTEELREKNPEIQAARYRFEAATKRPSQVGTLPDPKFSATNFGVGHPFSELNGSNFANQSVGISQ